MPTGYVEYDSNNSGGSWWLTDQNWKDLESAGWEVEWGGKYFCNSRYEHHARPLYLSESCPAGSDCPGHRRFQSADEMSDSERWLGCLAQKAVRRGLTLRGAAEEWERITGKRATDAGCACCGQPHTFTEYDASGEYVTSGPHASYEASC